MSLGETAAALERALLEALGDAWAVENQNRFHKALRRPSFRLDDSRTRLAAWVPGPRELLFSRALVRTAAWGVVLEVLKHEMAHQYAHEVLGALDETSHGRAFQDVCARYGVDAAAAGLPNADGLVEGPARPAADDRVMRRIAKLLALAESPNAHEAQSAMNAAQALLLRHNLDRVDARPNYVWRHLGAPAPRLQAADRWMGAILLGHFFVEGIWVTAFEATTGRSGTVLEIAGTPENVEMAAYVYDFLRATSERLWAAQVRSGGAPRGGRRGFVAGVMRGFYERLQEQAKTQREEGLVWLGDPGNKRFMRDRHPRVHTVRRSGPARTDAWEQGRAAGREIVLHKPVTGSSGNRGNLLS